MSATPANLATRKIPAPRVLPETSAYWAAANTGQLLVKKCADCGEFHHYPRDICPHCLSANTVWQPAAGTGTVYSFSTMGKGEAAYTLAFVTLDEGVTMMTNLVDCDISAVQINQRVRVVFKSANSGSGGSGGPGGPGGSGAGQAVPMFTPV